jgi:hypothetical protein
VKGTKLWNQPRSPLIQGRSRRERPFWTDWIAGGVCGLGIGLLLAITLLVPKDASLVEVTRAVAIPVLAGTAAGSAMGVWVAGAFGWHPKWVTGGVCGTAVALVATWIAIAVGGAPR